MWGRGRELETEEPLEREAEPSTCKAWAKLRGCSPYQKHWHSAKVARLERFKAYRARPLTNLLLKDHSISGTEKFSLQKSL